jgi:hypothetical protein
LVELGQILPPSLEHVRISEVDSETKARTLLGGLARFVNEKSDSHPKLQSIRISGWEELSGVWQSGHLTEVKLRKACKSHNVGITKRMVDAREGPPILSCEFCEYPYPVFCSEGDRRRAMVTPRQAAGRGSTLITLEWPTEE